MKYFLTIFSIFSVLIHKYFALDFDNYTLFINQLNSDEAFLDNYADWSLKLFSREGYIYGNRHSRFPCLGNHSRTNSSIPTSVHKLQPGDFKCIGALGDGLTTGLATQAITPAGLLFESRGTSWSIGRDYTFSKFISLPNILREYTPDLQGFSTTVSAIISNDVNSTDNGLNAANSEDYSMHLPYQTEYLIDRIKTEQLCNWKDDWKLITVFIGVNDLCSFCEDSNGSRYTPEQYIKNIREGLDVLHQARIPRTFVNLVPPLDVRIFQQHTAHGQVCQTLLKRLCPCAASPTAEQAKILDDYVQQYYALLHRLIASKRYDDRDDFTVVAQPFMKTIYHTHGIDLSYFAPDCFHFSGKGHSQAALSLWNNMLEPVGGKHPTWSMGNSLKCPTKEYPYIFTSKNSAKALDEHKRTTTAAAQSASTSTSTRARTSTMMISTSELNTTIESFEEEQKPVSKLPMRKSRLVLITIILVSIIIIVVWMVHQRRKNRLFQFPSNRREFSLQRIADDDDDENDDAEVWNKSRSPPTYFEDNQTTKTHGTRVSFE